MKAIQSLYIGEEMNTTPIKFMAWDKVEKILTQSGIKYKKVREELVCGDNQILMQLTALRSINDEPIYNHMIVKNEFGDHFIVDMFNYQIMEFLTRFDLEIVGNKFQNPELLELCK